MSDWLFAAAKYLQPLLHRLYISLWKIKQNIIYKIRPGNAYVDIKVLKSRSVNTEVLYIILLFVCLRSDTKDTICINRIYYRIRQKNPRALDPD